MAGAFSPHLLLLRLWGQCLRTAGSGSAMASWPERGPWLLPLALWGPSMEKQGRRHGRFPVLSEQG